MKNENRSLSTFLCNRNIYLNGIVAPRMSLLTNNFNLIGPKKMNKKSKFRRLAYFFPLLFAVPLKVYASDIPTWVMNPSMEMEGGLAVSNCAETNESLEELYSWSFAEIAQAIDKAVNPTEKSSEEGENSEVIETVSTRVSSTKFGNIVHVDVMDKLTKVVSKPDIFERTAKLSYHLPESTKTRTVWLYSRLEDKNVSTSIDKEGLLGWDTVSAALAQSEHFKLIHQDVLLGGQNKTCVFVGVRHIRL